MGEAWWGFWLLERTCLKFKTRFLINAEHEVHVLDCLTDSAFEEVIDTRSDEELAVDLLTVDESLIGVDHLLEVEGLIDIMGKGGILVEVLITLDD